MLSIDTAICVVYGIDISVTTVIAPRLCLVASLIDDRRTFPEPCPLIHPQWLTDDAQVVHSLGLPQ